MSFVISTTTRELQAGSTMVSIQDGDGVAGDPIIDIVPANIDINDLSGELSSPDVRKYLSADHALSLSTSNTYVQATPFTWDVESGEIWKFRVLLNFLVTGPQGTSTFELGVSTTGSGTLLSPSAITTNTFGNLTTNNGSMVGSNSGVVQYEGVYEASTAGTLSVTLKGASQNTSIPTLSWTIVKGSSLEAYKVSAI